MEKIKVIWDLDDDKIYRIAGKCHARTLLLRSGIVPAVLKEKDMEILSELIGTKLALVTRGKARYFGDFDTYYNVLRFKRNKTEEERKTFEELKTLRKEIKKNPVVKKLLQLAALETLLEVYRVNGSIREVEIATDRIPVVLRVEHDRIDEKIMEILRKYRKTLVPTFKNTLIDPNEIEKVWLEFETVRQIVSKTYIENGQEREVEEWQGIVTGAALGRNKKVTISIKKLMRIKMKTVTGKVEEYKIFLPTVIINGKVFEVENNLPTNLHVLKPKFISVRIDKSGNWYVKKEIPVEFTGLNFGGFKIKVPKRVVVQWKLVNTKSPSARLVLARKKFRSYAGAVQIYYKVKTRDGKVYSYRKYTLILFWCGHALVTLKDKSVKTKEFARLYGILIDNDTDAKYLVKLGYDEQSEVKKNVRRYYLNLMPHGHGSIVFGNQAVLVVENKMKKALLKYMVRNAKEMKRVYSLEGWSGNLNHDIISIHPFKLVTKDAGYNGTQYRVFIIIPTRNGQEIDILNHHHKSQGLDRITVKLNMNDLLIIVHQHPDMANHEMFRQKEFWKSVERIVGVPVLPYVEYYCY